MQAIVASNSENTTKISAQLRESKEKVPRIIQINIQNYGENYLPMELTLAVSEPYLHCNIKTSDVKFPKSLPAM